VVIILTSTERDGFIAQKRKERIKLEISLKLDDFSGDSYIMVHD
jgi:hypothetical protein